MRTALFLLAFVAIPAVAAQAVWKWVDERGVTHYSDRPVPGATRVELATGTRTGAESPRPTAASSAAGEGAAQSQSSEPAVSSYRNFEIWKPAEGETIANSGGQVTVNVRSEPDLQSEHTLHLYLDGRLVQGFPPTTTSFNLTDVPRGMHRLIAVINDARGTRLQETAPVSFMVRQESVANPPVGPALRPPPKPQPRGANKLPSSQPGYAQLHGEHPVIDPATNLPVRKPAPKPGPRPGG